MPFASLIPAQPPSDWVNVVDYLTAGRTPGVTDDRAGFITALAATTAYAILYIPPGLYRISQYVEIQGAYGLQIWGPGARIQYPSASGSTDAIADTISRARSCFLLRYCTNVTIEGVTFEGDTNPDITVNVGHGVYPTRTVGLTLRDCNQINGASLIQHDALSATSNVGDSLTVAAGVVTLVDASASFKSGHGIGVRYVTISGATNPLNNGTFRILSYVSATTITYANTDAVNETSSFRWTIDDNDRGLKIIGGSSTNARLNVVPTNDTVIDGHRFDHPNTPDLTGEGGSFSISGTTVTFSTQSKAITPDIVNRYVTFSGATTAGNNGRFLITAATAKSGNTAATLTYTNASGVTELMPRSPATGVGRWWIANGEKTGLGAGVAALTKSGTTMTLTASSAVFAATDVNKSLRVMSATSGGNNNSFAITAYVSPTQVQYTNSSGVAEDYSGLFTIDGFDRIGNFGASHAIYAFAGRSNVRVVNCTFRNIRLTAVKASGSASPITDISVEGCYFLRCGSAAVFGADDSQEHDTFHFVNNVVVDCAQDRAGWDDQNAVSIYGSRAVRITGNTFRYTRNNIASVDGRSFAGRETIHLARYVSAISQPVEDVLIDSNKFVVDGMQTSPDKLVNYVINGNEIGTKAHWGTPTTLTKSGNTMTLTHASSKFSAQLVGRGISHILAADAGNIGHFTVESVPSSTTLTFTNAAGVATATPGGTYRIFPDQHNSTASGTSRHRANWLAITNNYFDNIGADASISLTRCASPEIRGNRHAGTARYVLSGCSNPEIVDNVLHGTADSTGNIRLTDCSWPLISGNYAHGVGHYSTSAAARDWQISDSAGTVFDYPLLGNRGRNVATNAFEEAVISWGSGHVDGDSVVVNGTVLTYKATAPSANQFNSIASLYTAINALAGVIAADYGSLFTTPITTQHVRIRRTAQSATDGNLTVNTNTLNPTALVNLRNTNTPGMASRGSGSAGPIPDAIVAWSPLAGHTSVVHIMADNTAARGVLAGGYMVARNLNDSGCCAVVKTTNRTDDGALVDLGGEYRWSLVS